MTVDEGDIIPENSAVGALGDYERNSDYILHIAKPEGSGMAVAF